LAVGVLRNEEFHYSLTLKFSNKGVIKIFGLMLPLVLGMLFYKIVPLFDRWLASGLPEGSISILGYSTKLVNILQSITTTGVSVSLFPLMSGLAARNDYLMLKEKMGKGIKILLYVTIPMSILLGVDGKSAIPLLFERGAFGKLTSENTFNVFSIYMIALPATAIGTIIGQGYYIFQDSVTPVIVGILETIFYIAVSLVLVRMIGLLAIPSSCAIYFNFSILVNGYFVSKKLDHLDLKKILLPSIIRYGILAMAIALIIRIFNYVFVPNAFIGIALLGLGFALYFSLTFLIFNTDESKILWGQLIVRVLSRSKTDG